jgi:hypothetical protein
MNRTSDNDLGVPSAIGDGAWQLWFLSVMFFVIAATSAVGFHSAVFSAQSRFRSMFLFSTMVLGVFRGLITLVHVRWDEVDHPHFWLLIITSFIPIFLQYVTFSLLFLFVGRTYLIVRGREDRVHGCLYPFYVVVQFVVLLVCVVASWLLALESSDDAKWDQKPALVAGCLYGLLFGCGAYASYKFWQMRAIFDAESETGPAASGIHYTEPGSPVAGGSGGLKPGSSWRKVLVPAVVILLYLIVFAGRCIWNISYYFNRNDVQNQMSSWITNHDEVSYYNAYLLFYFAFEVVPTGVCVLGFSFFLQRRLVGSGVNAVSATTPLLNPRSRPPSESVGPDGKNYLLARLADT